MPSLVYGQIREAFRYLNPNQVRDLASRPLNVGLIASSHEGFAAMEALLAPASLSQARRVETVRSLHRVDDTGPEREFDLVICEQELLPPCGAFLFDRDRPEATVQAILDRREDLSLALASNFLPFRKPVIARVIRAIARENAAFSVVTALPDVIPSLIELPWAVGEFASDTAFLTMNQVRMAFQIAGASDQDVGYKQQRAQIAGIVAGAFGWRALARELVGKIPFGGGLVPKAAIAYAGTYTVGVGLERFYRIGSGLTRTERREVYRQALDRGRTIVDAIVQGARRQNPAA
ncbi:MAG TPA: hypothetical protein VHA11_10325 [Bryobacteraceae bacterium]|nr:hypothetical protein [Bryobacteraceae bacterium]